MLVYLWASGSKFDAQLFVQEHGVGSLRHTQVMNGDLVIDGPTEWESPGIEIPDEASQEQVVRSLLDLYGGLVDEAKKVNASEIYLQFVGDQDTYQDVSLSPELMQILADRGISIDYDGLLANALLYFLGAP